MGTGAKNSISDNKEPSGNIPGRKIYNAIATRTTPRTNLVTLKIILSWSEKWVLIKISGGTNFVLGKLY